MNLKVMLNTFLVRLNIRKVLPGEIIRKMNVVECHEKLIHLPSTFFSTNRNLNHYGRKTVIEKIINVNSKLEKKGYKIFVFEIYRDEETQKNMRLQEYDKVKKEFPNFSEIELEKMLDKRVANIKNNNVGGHQTGGAIDLTICNNEGNELDMGTKYLEFNDKTKSFSKELTQEQQNNRKMLLKIMKSEDFVNYPNEWWHFSYGDSMWAAYKNKKRAFYGKANKGMLSI